MVAHYYGAIVFVASLALHVIVKTAGGPARLPRARRAQAAARQPREHEAGAGDEHGARADPAEPTISRRGLFAFAGAGALTLLLGNVGQSIGGPLRKLALLAPRRDERLPGQQDRARPPASRRR